jgi:3-isopropylmalate/(R)-2-methylmalate dehydratase large subunit
MTATQKILARAAGKTAVKAGELIEAKVDMVLANDITGPVAIDEFEKIGAKTVFDKDKIALVPDHFTPNKDIKSAENAKRLRDFARKHDITNYFEIGRMGIEHCLLPEAGLVGAGDVVIGADSHTCTYGALGAFSTGVGSTDAACAMATGKLWFKVPDALKIILKNKPAKWISGKDIILHIVGLIGVDGALYKSMEFAGGGVNFLTGDDKFTIANMSIEAGAKNGIFPQQIDADEVYGDEITIELDKLQPTVAFPHLPSNVKTVAEAGGIKLDQVIIGSCTNGRFGDLKIAAEILKGRKIASGLRVIIIPGTQKIYLEALRAGFIETFINAGAIVSTPTCGPCIGGHMGVLASGERALATTNRNFIGRMGAKDSEIYLASPAVAAASAIAGKISGPEAV